MSQLCVNQNTNQEVYTFGSSYVHFLPPRAICSSQTVNGIWMEIISLMSKLCAHISGVFLTINPHIFPVCLAVFCWHHVGLVRGQSVLSCVSGTLNSLKQLLLSFKRTQKFWLNPPLYACVCLIDLKSEITLG